LYVNLFENRVLKRIFGPKEEETEENNVSSCIICIPIRSSYKEG